VFERLAVSCSWSYGLSLCSSIESTQPSFFHLSPVRFPSRLSFRFSIFDFLVRSSRYVSVPDSPKLNYHTLSRWTSSDRICFDIFCPILDFCQSSLTSKAAISITRDAVLLNVTAFFALVRQHAQARCFFFTWFQFLARRLPLSPSAHNSYTLSDSTPVKMFLCYPGLPCSARLPTITFLSTLIATAFALKLETDTSAKIFWYHWDDSSCFCEYSALRFYLITVIVVTLNYISNWVVCIFLVQFVWW